MAPAAGKHPSISLCMIVRDEEEFLARCLGSVQGLADEICIVDTGSTDRTLEIAAQFGAGVRSIEWPDSFAQARNASLEMASGDWVLVLDADEALVAEAGAELRRLSLRDDLAGAILRFRHHLDHGVQEGRLLRFFRNGPESRFEGAIHEQLGAGFERRARELGQGILMSGVTVEHFGYLSDVSDRRDKEQRNRVLFERALGSEPGNLYLRFKYADFLRGAGERGAATRELQLVCDRLGSGGEAICAFHAEAFALLALELLERGDVDAAGLRLSEAEGRVEPTVHFHFVRASWLLRVKRWSEALAEFRASRSVDGMAALHVPAVDVRTWRTSLGIATALEGLNRRQEAERILREETLRSAHVGELWIEYASLLARSGCLRLALDACMDGLRACPASAPLWIRCAELMLEGKFYANAVQAAERAVRFAGAAQRERALELRERCSVAQG